MSSASSVTLCLTRDCNLRCAYCYAGHKVRESMTEETARRAVDFAVERHAKAKSGEPLVLGFFGGEPLLEWNLLMSTDAYAEKRCAEAGIRLRRTVTTNLTLLTPERAAWLKERDYRVGLSIDGDRPAHDRFRRYADGTSSHADCLRGLDAAAAAGLDAECILVTDPATVDGLAASVRFLAGRVSLPLSININYHREWSDADGERLERQYRLIADFFVERYRAGRPLHVTWLDAKIKTHLYGGYHECDRCAMGVKELAVSVRGDLFPCCNLVGDGDDPALVLGNIFDGFDAGRLLAFSSRCGNHNPACEGCPVAARCMNWCGCVNYVRSKGDCGWVSPLTCFHEKLCIRLADEAANTLWRERNPAFLAFCREK